MKSVLCCDQRHWFIFPIVVGMGAQWGVCCVGQDMGDGRMGQTQRLAWGTCGLCLWRELDKMGLGDQLS